MKVLYDKSEILVITALKSIEFIYETVGCSLSQMVPQLLKTIILTYPLKPSQDPLNLGVEVTQLDCRHKTESTLQTDLSSSKSKTLVDSYHHLFETLIGLLPLMNRKFLRSMFKDIIVPNLSNTNSMIKN
jgi:hypothetical protein